MLGLSWAGEIGPRLLQGSDAAQSLPGEGKGFVQRRSP